jgi:hypothetical protein
MARHPACLPLEAFPGLRVGQVHTFTPPRTPDRAILSADLPADALDGRLRHGLVRRRHPVECRSSLHSQSRSRGPGPPVTTHSCRSAAGLTIPIIGLTGAREARLSRVRVHRAVRRRYRNSHVARAPSMADTIAMATVRQTAELGIPALKAGSGARERAGRLSLLAPPSLSVDAASQKASPSGALRLLTR